MNLHDTILYMKRIIHKGLYFVFRTSWYLFRLLFIIINHISLCIVLGTILYGLPTPVYSNARTTFKKYTGLSLVGDTIELIRLYSKSQGKDIFCQVFVERYNETKKGPIVTYYEMLRYMFFDKEKKHFRYITNSVKQTMCMRNDEISSLSLNPITLSMDQWRRWHSFSSPLAWERYINSIRQMYSSYNEMPRFEDKYHALYQIYLKMCFGVSLA